MLAPRLLTQGQTRGKNTLVSTVTTIWYQSKEGAAKVARQNKQARTDAGLSKLWLLDLGSNQGPTD
jgi:hypothetical protein